MASRVKRALISVYDKTGIVAFARALSGEFGVEILSTGGTARLLKESDIPVTLVEEVTGSGEMLDGRVKTLHPRIHAAILADRDNPDHMRQLAEAGIEPIDMVVVNLYPFEETIAKPGCTFDEAIEMIDIGGPCMLRAAAKNHKHVLVVGSPNLYAEVLEKLSNASGDDLARERARSARGVYLRTSEYDAAVSSYLFRREYPDSFSSVQVQSLCKMTELRYGENPHQRGALFAINAKHDDVSLFKELPPKDASFNNYVDAQSALDICAELSRSQKSSRKCAVFVKHTNACGCAVADDATQAYRNAYLGDPNAAMGGILAVNFKVDAEFAEIVMGTFLEFGKPLKEAGHPAAPGGFFVEVVIAPEIGLDALEIIRKRKDWGQRVRVFCSGDTRVQPYTEENDYKKITGAFLMQDRDLTGLNENEWKVATRREPTDSEMNDLRLAWLVCKHTKSNAISVCKDGMLVGNGAGQMSRVMSCRIATWLAKENGHEKALAGSVAASDAFFPFRDGPDILMDAGVTAIIQPGGSKRDEDTIAACDGRGVAMVFTGTRHFKH